VKEKYKDECEQCSPPRQKIFGLQSIPNSTISPSVLIPSPITEFSLLELSKIANSE